LCIAESGGISDLSGKGEFQKKREVEMNKPISRFAMGLALAGALTVGSATASFAFGGDRYYYEHDDNGSVWSFYSGYYDGANRNATNYSGRNAYGSAAHQQQHAHRQQHQSHQQQSADESR
jgi:hypothetical protein